MKALPLLGHSPEALNSCVPLPASVPRRSWRLSLTTQALLLLLAVPATSMAVGTAGSVLEDLPESIDPAATYVIYLHGAILESEGPEAVHPDFGPYRYADILDAMAARGATVLSELRPEGTDGVAYATVVASWVDTLLSAGVPPANVTIVGFSKGGGIAMKTCELVANDQVGYVFMACCPRRMLDWPEVPYRGRILSIYEASDPLAGSCREAVLGFPEADEKGDYAGAVEVDSGSAEVGDAGTGVVFDEIEIDTGLRHGAFYRPLDAWLGPAMNWAMDAGGGAAPASERD